MIYSFKSRVRYSEIGQNGRMTLPALINYFQDCSTFQSEEIGLGVELLHERQKAWFLSYWQIEINHLPTLGEEITVGTFATEFKGLYGNRNFFMDGAGGIRLACANSIWVFMDLQRGRPVRPQEEEIAPYGIEIPLQMDYEGRKIALPSDWEAREPFPVRKHHIDTNGHVNNGQYVQMAMEMLPDDTEVHRLRVDYKKAAVLGDWIYPRVSLETDRAVVELCDEAGRPYAVIELKEKPSGK